MIADGSEQTSDVNASLQAALDVVPEGFALFDAEDRCLMWNARYASLWANWGVTLTSSKPFEDMLREGLAAGRYPEASGRSEAWLAEQIARRSSDHLDEMRDEFGEHLRFESRRTPAGGLVTTCINITDLRRREAEALAAQGFLDTVVENVPAMLFVKDGETGRFMLVNRAAEGLLACRAPTCWARTTATSFPRSRPITSPLSIGRSSRAVSSSPSMKSRWIRRTTVDAGCRRARSPFRAGTAVVTCW
jgi:PAS domain-containing protein